MRAIATSLLTLALTLVPLAAQAADAPAPAPFGGVLQRVKDTAAKGHHPIVIFDLDDTLLRTADRNLAVLDAWLATDAGKAYAAKRPQISLTQVGWGIETALDALGVSAADKALAKRFWAERFFSSDYLHFDHPNPGAIAFVKAVRQAGARVVYLSGRPEKLMRAGTEAALKQDGFPWDPTGKQITLELKAQAGSDDATFKGEEAKALARTGEVVASFDNEPGNVNMFHRVLPQATVVFLETVHSPNAVPVDAGIIKVPSFPTP